ncbi:DUF1015 domain-containing protein [Nocardiopsis suaedae]|uniref:DUF1015 domain-containing protein n=1 Tax=Nocardiopsis suaedae TaxID=3018444 RepID=A0ABT4TTT9_9ACTN|nr:DUF1015 domain-containing protein [Nocardiopsis suaedae]MDA2808103.1 DUF1015 domain-containing protein [Nocardiopsis suaedae]
MDTGEGALELAPLRGLRYAGADASALIDSPDFNLALALSPPYDLVDAASYARMTRVEPLNAARLTAPPAVDWPDRYTGAARTLRRWVGEGVLVRDPSPAVYAYEQTTPGGLRQRGLIGLLRLPPPGSGAVRPHEAISEEPVLDRARLMAATRANLEPILLLYRGGRGAERGAASQAADDPAEKGDEPLVDTVTGDGVTHRLWALTDTRTHARIARDLAGRTALIADGHHRYAAYRRLQARQCGPGPWDLGLALLVDSEASPPRLGPIHRVLPGLDPRAAAEAVRAHARVRELPGGTGPAGAARLLAEAARSGPALAVGDGRGFALIDQVSPEAMRAAAPDRSEDWRGMASAVLERLLLPLWRTGAEEAELVHDDPAEAVRRADARPGPASAVLLPALRVEDVYAVTARGELTPRKSTSFGPKPRTGLVLRSLESVPERTDEAR